MNAQKVTVIGAALDLGASRRGVDMGPSAIRYAGLKTRLTELGLTVEDAGDVEAPVVETIDLEQLESPNARFLTEIQSTCSALSEQVRQAVDAGSLPLVLGGDHSIAVGSIGGVALSQGDLGVLWLDAHADMNTPETTPSGNVHGMPLAALLGRFPALLGEGWPSPVVAPERVALVGLRSVDKYERELIRELGLAAYTMYDIDRRGLVAVMEEALERVGQGPLHVSFDLDVVDPLQAPGVGTPVPGGLTYREAHMAMEVIADSGRLRSLDLVELNPVLDLAGQTARLAVELAASALGSRIL